MFSEGALKIEVHRGNKVSVLDVHYPRALIGSGAHCDVRLMPDEAAVEQLVVELVGEDEVYARTRTVKRPVLLNGAPFLEGRLSPTSMLELGAVALCVQRVAKADGDVPVQREAGGVRPSVRAAGVLAVAVGAVVVLGPSSQDAAGLERGVKPPAIAAIANEPCPQSEPLAAAALAQQLRDDAESKRERAPFYPSDAAAAVPLFERAASCYEVTGAKQPARESHEAAKKLQAQIADEVHVRHVRLERFLVQKQYEQARRQAEVLAELVPATNAAYTNWLSSVRREAELRNVSNKRSKR